MVHCFYRWGLGGGGHTWVIRLGGKWLNVLLVLVAVYCFSLICSGARAGARGNPSPHKNSCVTFEINMPVGGGVESGGVESILLSEADVGVISY